MKFVEFFNLGLTYRQFLLIDMDASDNKRDKEAINNMQEHTNNLQCYLGKQMSPSSLLVPITVFLPILKKNRLTSTFLTFYINNCSELISFAATEVFRDLPQPYVSLGLNLILRNDENDTL